MAEPYGVFLENPRMPRRGRGGRFVKGGSRRRRSTKRRRSSARRRRSTKRRRRNPHLLTVNPRRRRRSAKRRTTRRRRRSTRRNPFRLSGRGDIRRTMMAGLGLAGGEVVGDVLARVSIKAGAGKLFNIVKVPTNFRAPLLRIAVGLFGTPLLRMLRLPSAVTSSFGAVNVASGVLALTSNMRQQTYAKVGLGDYELADVLVGDDDDDIELGDVLVGYGDDDDDDGELSDYELADYELAGDYSDQDYYLNYEAT